MKNLALHCNRGPRVGLHPEFESVGLGGGLFHAKCVVYSNETGSRSSGYGTSFFWSHAKQKAYSEAWERNLSREVPSLSRNLRGTAVHADQPVSKAKAVSEFIERKCLYDLFSARYDSLSLERARKFSDGNLKVSLFSIKSGTALVEIIWVKTTRGWSYVDAIHEPNRFKKWMWRYEVIHKAKRLFSLHTAEELDANPDETNFFSLLNPKQTLALSKRLETLGCSQPRTERNIDLHENQLVQTQRVSDDSGKELYFSFVLDKELPPLSKSLLS